MGGTKLKEALICLLLFHLGGERELLRYELDQLGLVEQDCLREKVASLTTPKNHSSPYEEVLHHIDL